MIQEPDRSTATAEPVSVIENPVTGERVRFLRRGANTDGELVELEVVAQPYAIGPPAHVHEHQEETFAVLEGEITGTFDGDPFTLSAGESLVIPAGTPHRWWNDGDEELRVQVEVRPAMEFAEFLETMYGLATDGQTNAKGIPNPLQMAVIADHYWETSHLASPPTPIQKLALGILAPIGRLFGYRPFYQKYQSSKSAAV